MSGRLFLPEEKQIQNAKREQPESTVEQSDSQITEPARINVQISLNNLRPMRNVPERSEYHRLQVRLDEHLSQTQEHPYEIDRKGEQFQRDLRTVEKIIDAGGSATNRDIFLKRYCLDKYLEGLKEALAAIR